jgi:hypothetical protein
MFCVWLGFYEIPHFRLTIGVPPLTETRSKWLWSSLKPVKLMRNTRLSSLEILDFDRGSHNFISVVLCYPKSQFDSHAAGGKVHP